MLAKLQVSKTLPKNNPDANKEGILRERLIPLEIRHKNYLRLKEEIYWSPKINIVI